MRRERDGGGVREGWIKGKRRGEGEEDIRDDDE